MQKKNKAQVWVETAIYTLIGLTIIAIVLAVAVPQINKIKDKSVITQTIDALNTLDNKLLEIQQAPGNIRIIYFKLAKGKIEIDSENDKIIYSLENTNLELSEPGEEIREGNIVLKTEKYGRNFNIFLTLDYSEDLDLTYKTQQQNQILQSGSADYKIKLENPGDSRIDEKIHLDLDIL